MYGLNYKYCSHNLLSCTFVSDKFKNLLNRISEKTTNAYEEGPQTDTHLSIAVFFSFKKKKKNSFSIIKF